MDSTYVATFRGFVYVAMAIDVFSLMIVGWRAAKSMTTDLPLDALDMAFWQRSRAGHDVHGVETTATPAALTSTGPGRCSGSTTARTDP